MRKLSNKVFKQQCVSLESRGYQVLEIMAFGNWARYMSQNGNVIEVGKKPRQ